jgi:hypothetical protein
LKSAEGKGWRQVAVSTTAPPADARSVTSKASPGVRPTPSARSVKA